MKKDEGEDYSDHCAHLIDRDDLRGLTDLQGTVIAQPGGAGRQAGGDQKDPAFAADAGNPLAGMGDEYHAPGHCQDHAGSYCGSKIRIYSCYTDLCEN